MVSRSGGTAPPDHETRERLLAAAATLFASRGFKKVTVHEICLAARANVAAVNYHFGDKLGLYRDVRQAVASIQAQTIAYLPNPVSTRLGFAFRPTTTNLDEVAGHIATLSLAGVRALAPGRTVERSPSCRSSCIPGRVGNPPRVASLRVHGEATLPVARDQ